MAPIGGPTGGGQSGFGSGGSFTGPAEALEIIGNHAYAYSGIQTIASAGTFQTLLDFTTGNYLFVGTISWCGDSASSSDFYVNIKLNGTLIWNSAYLDSKAAMSDQPLPLIIPAYTEFEGSLTSDSTEDVGLMMAGRIYRTRD